MRDAKAKMPFTECPADEAGSMIQDPMAHHLRHGLGPTLTMTKTRARRSLLAATICFVAAFICGGRSAADERAHVELFEKRIRPVLNQSCYKCHSGRTDEPKGGLRLDSRDAIRQGGESGPAVVPGRPEDSLLISALRYESLQMPPRNRLSDEVIEHFVEWIELGAVDPRDQPDFDASTDSWSTILQTRRGWWSLQPVTDPLVPHAKGDWPRRDLDRFILEKLRNAGLQPAESAAPHQQIRRLSIVLTGLPPTPTEIEQYLLATERDADVAQESLVNRLLDSPHFGERWTRHWMDVVRYTETHGNEWNYEVHHAWRYRDYLIRAFNADVPYDQFVREHIAGDLLESPRQDHEAQINESLIGTSFYRFGEVNHDDCVALTSIGYDILDNQIDTLSKAFQATTIACARCHHHKIDAVSMDDYYALLGILKSSRLTAHTIDTNSVNAKPLQRLEQLKQEVKAEVARHWQSQTGDVARYLLAADAKVRESAQAAEWASDLDATRLEQWVAALKVNDAGVDHPAWAWLQTAGATDFASTWSSLTQTFSEARDDHANFNRDQFTSFADFRHPDTLDWTATGQGLRSSGSASGEFTVAHEGDHVIASVLPAGRFTHALSQKLNGTLRSPVVPAGSKQISAQVLGDKTSAFRLISNNCQLNYTNYRALTSSKPTWVTFKVPDDAQALSTFAELVTKFDNPKFPDQLGTLGGDRTNDRIPWSEAAADPRSYFGIMRVVLHEGTAPPKPDLTPISRLFDRSVAVSSRDELAQRYADAIDSAVNAWAADEATDDDVCWLSWVVNHGLLDQAVTASSRLTELVTEYRSIESREVQRPRIAAGMADSASCRDHRLLERGNFDAPGKSVPRRYLGVLAVDGQPFVPKGSGRLELAHAIASPENPLTARVMVNRIWHYMFGTGIVRTVDDFGQVGELPSHLALLDHLTTRFTTSVSEGGMGWSIKRLIREIALSQTFRMSNRPDDAAKTVDPQNRLLHHFPVRRMEAEAIRDSILAISGRLRNELYGMSIQPYRAEANEYRRLFAGPLDGDGRRSVYIKINLMESAKFLSSFNLPGGKVAQGRRDVTNVPAQALTMLNDRFVLQQAEVWSQRLIETDAETVAVRLDSMFLHALGRAPSPSELDRFESLVETLARLHSVPENQVSSHRAIWKDVAHVIFNLKEFIYIP
jgi:hypothetical protein